MDAPPCRYAPYTVIHQVAEVVVWRGISEAEPQGNSLGRRAMSDWKERQLEIGPVSEDRTDLATNGPSVLCASASLRELVRSSQALWRRLRLVAPARATNPAIATESAPGRASGAAGDASILPTRTAVGPA